LFFVKVSSIEPEGGRQSHTPLYVSDQGPVFRAVKAERLSLNALPKFGEGFGDNH